MNYQLSIVMPVYQVEKYIKNTIISLVNQTDTRFQLILVDDGSNDNSIVIAKSLLENSKLNYLILYQENKGVSAARNLGIENARTEWITFIDSDDTITTDYVETILHDINEYACDAYSAGFKFVKEKNLFKESDISNNLTIYNNNEILELFLQRRVTVILTTFVVKKEVLLKNHIEFNVETRYSEDLEFIWKYLFCCSQVLVNKKDIYNYCLRENSTMTGSGINKILTGFNAMIKMKEIVEDQEFYKRLLSRWVFATMHSGAKMLSYKDFNILLSRLNYKVYLCELKCFKDKRVSLLSRLCLVSRFFFYTICKYI